MQYIIQNKGRVTQWFGCAPNYVKITGICHSGIDSVKGWNKPHYLDNDGYCYKVYDSDASDAWDGWRGAYFLTPIDDTYELEFVYGHFNEVLPMVGEYWKAGKIIGYEGNRGMVFSGGERITKEMQEAGDRRGHHMHSQVRPVKKVKKVNPNTHYLRNANGSRYQGVDGMYREIVFSDNKTKGCINPMLLVGGVDKVEKILDIREQQLTIYQEVIKLLMQIKSILTKKVAIKR